MKRSLFVGDDWAEEHHEVELQDETGRRLGKAKLAEGIAGVDRLHAMVGEHLDEDDGPVEVVVGIETDLGGWVRRCSPRATSCTRSTRCRWRGFGKPNAAAAARAIAPTRTP